MDDLPPIILASRSPRRAKLLREAGIVFTQITPPFDDSGFDAGQLKAIELVEKLAYEKASSLAVTLDKDIVLGCDTVLAIEDRAIGKPRDREDAAAILNDLFANPHQAICGVALVDAITHRKVIFHDITEVRILRPCDEVLQAYLDSDEWEGKAGGYNLAELESQWKFTITGDPTTVIGLPMLKLPAAIVAFARQLGTCS